MFHYRIWRIYLEQLKDDPERQMEMIHKLLHAMEEDYQHSLKKESPS